jgi:thiopurine S-methyltransferase
MDKRFWHERWQRREIGFHQSDIHWALKRHWTDICGSSSAQVLVPLSGKSLDMRWLADRGHPVTGIELSGQAIEEFFGEWHRTPQGGTCGGLPRRRADGIELAEGDFFEFRPGQPFDLFYDRAALVALPESLRGPYLAQLRECLSPGASGLLVTFEYDARQMDGPPFPVLPEELSAQEGFRFELLERRDVLLEHQSFAEKGLDSLHECAWRVRAA